MLPPGTLLGAYKITRPLGEGGMGAVLEAEHQVLGRRSAIKFLHPELATDAGLVARFLQEARAVNLINHDHIVNIYDFSDGSDGAVYFVMEFLEGESLFEILCVQPRLPLPLFFDIFSQILKALAAAHAKQVIHRDLKPANVFVLDRDGAPFVKLLDFGVAKLTAEGAAQVMTAAGALIGTPHYMSPEQFAGKVVDTRTDVWAIGVMMYQVLAGHLPFDGRELTDLAIKITRENPTPLSLLAPDLEGVGQLESLINRALAKRPEDRYQRVVDMAAALEGIRRELGLSPSAGDPELPAPPVEVRPGATGRGKLIATLAAGLLVAAAVAVAMAATFGGSGAETAAGVDAAAAQPEATGLAAVWARDRAEAASQASETLRESMRAEKRSIRAAAIGALEAVGEPALAPLLYEALDGQPELKVRGARALGRLRLPEAAGKVRAALSRSSDRLRVELAVVMVELGDKDAVALLEGAMRDSPRDRFSAAVALAPLGNKEAVEIVASTFASAPAGKPRWLRAGQALIQSGDEKARDAIAAELRQVDPRRVMDAALVLGELGDDEAVETLTRLVADETFELRGEAALALAGRSDPAARVFIADGLASAAARDRQLAAAIAARLGRAERGAELAAMAAGDADVAARLTANAALVVLARGRQGVTGSNR